MKPNSSISNSELFGLLKKLFFVVICFVLIILGVLLLQRLTRAKSTLEIRDLSESSFFEDPKQYDVVFLGTSHMLYGISPFDVWDESGITSYNWGSPACTIPSTYWKLINILDYRNPELVVVDCFSSTWEYKAVNEFRMHEAFDCFPASYNKYMAIRDLMNGQTSKDDEHIYTKEEQLNVLFPISAYHSRWDELEKKDIHNEFVDSKGAELLYGIAEPIEIADTSEKAEITPSMEGVTYLKKLIMECKNRNIPILLVYLPFPASEEYKMEANMIYDIAAEYEVNYIDFTRLDVVDYETDCFDSNSHLNLYGQEKVSRYIGRYISENYNVKNRKEDSEINAKWEEGYNNFSSYREKLLID